MSTSAGQASEIYFPDVGDKVYMRRTKEPISLESRIAEGGQGVVYRAMDDQGHDLAVKWYRKNKHITRQYNVVEELTNFSRPHKSFAWPIDIVLHDDIVGFGYAMQWIEPRFVSLIEVLKSRNPPRFRSLIEIGIELAEAFSSLHSKGLCYKDINFGNLLVDPRSSQVAIVDCDNIGSELTRRGIKGTLRFMAPELIVSKSVPSILTDLYSLSVFLFYLFFHGHPLEGRKLTASYSWHEAKNISETRIIMKFFGEEPLFIFDPNDDSNRPEKESPTNAWWPIYPEAFRSVFVSAFTEGLKNPNLMTRVNETRWKNALYRLNDLLTVCQCNAEVFIDFDEPKKICWHCGQVIKGGYRISFDNSTAAILSDGFNLTKHHLFKDFKYGEVIGKVERHPTEPAKLVFRNLSNLTWQIKPENEEIKEVKPGQRMLIRPMEIVFGNKKAYINL
jgi:DNA-binding helix-hairpin-helix protein with protein kinase domain